MLTLFQFYLSVSLSLSVVVSFAFLRSTTNANINTNANNNIRGAPITAGLSGWGSEFRVPSSEVLLTVPLTGGSVQCTQLQCTVVPGKQTTKTPNPSPKRPVRSRATTTTTSYRGNAFALAAAVLCSSRVGIYGEFLSDQRIQSPWRCSSTCPAIFGGGACFALFGGSCFSSASGLWRGVSISRKMSFVDEQENAYVFSSTRAAIRHPQDRGDREAKIEAVETRKSRRDRGCDRGDDRGGRGGDRGDRGEERGGREGDRGGQEGVLCCVRCLERKGRPLEAEGSPCLGGGRAWDHGVSVL